MIKELDEGERIPFYLYSKHIDFLDKINHNNRSLALRTLLDSVMNGDEQARRKKILDTTLTFIAYGSILFFISFLLNIYILKFSSLLTGIFLLCYGFLGGVNNLLQKTRKR